MDELQDKLEEPIEQVLGSDWEDLILEGGISHVDETLGEFLSSVDLSKKDKYQDLIAVMGETNVRISETKNVQVPFVTDFKPATKDAETAHLCFEYNIYASLYYYFVDDNVDHCRSSMRSLGYFSPFVTSKDIRKKNLNFISEIGACKILDLRISDEIRGYILCHFPK